MTPPEESVIKTWEIATVGGPRIAVAQLNAEKALNALTLEMIDLLAGHMAAWAKDPDIAIVLIEGAGERAFCAGADLRRMHRSMAEHRASDCAQDIRGNDYALAFFCREYRLDYAIHTYPKPVLVWGHGVVMGGGVGLMVGASHRVVTEHAKVAMPEISIGLYADVGGSWFLGRAPGNTGLFLALTAAQLDAGDAIFAGLADFSIAHARKADVLGALGTHAWGRDSERNAAALTRLLQGFESEAPAPGPLRRNVDLIHRLCRVEDPVELVNCLVGLRSEDAWLQRAAATLSAGSPTTAALSIALQRRLRHQSLAQVFRAEFAASLTCGVRPDLSEGIRALLIDKDRNPRWSPARIEAVSPEWIDGFFESPWTAEDHPLADLGS